jgi:hypothetical protein
MSALRAYRQGYLTEFAPLWTNPQKVESAGSKNAYLLLAHQFVPWDLELLLGNDSLTVKITL